jgi:hypothetical protein
VAAVGLSQEFEQELLDCTFSSHSAAFWAICGNCGKGLEFHRDHHDYAMSESTTAASVPRKLPTSQKNLTSGATTGASVGGQMKDQVETLGLEKYTKDNLDWIMSLTGLCKIKRHDRPILPTLLPEIKQRVASYFPSWNEYEIIEGIKLAIEQHNRACSRSMGIINI